MYILHTVLRPYIFYGNDQENLWNNQDHCYLLITFFFSQPLYLIELCYYKEKLDTGHC